MIGGIAEPTVPDLDWSRSVVSAAVFPNAADPTYKESITTPAKTVANPAHCRADSRSPRKTCA